MAFMFGGPILKLIIQKKVVRLIAYEDNEYLLDTNIYTSPLFKHLQILKIKVTKKDGNYVSCRAYKTTAVGC